MDTRNRLQGRKVLVSPDWFEAVSWSEKKVVVNVDRAHIESSPEYNTSASVDRDYEMRVYAHYGIAGYW